MSPLPLDPASPSAPYLVGRPRIYLISDSVMLGAASELQRRLGPSYDLLQDGFVGISLADAVDVTTSRLDRLGPVVVVQLGHNDDNPAAFAEHLNRMMALLARVDQVIWLTDQEFRPAQQQINQVLRDAVSRYHNLRVADWAAVATATPGLVGGQAGIHLTPRGAVAMVDLIERELVAWADSQLSPQGGWAALPLGFRGGLYPAAGPRGDGGALLVIGADAGGGPQVTMFNEAGARLGAFFAYPPDFTGGVRVAACDLDGDGVTEIITAPGPGGPPLVVVYRPDGQLVRALVAYEPAFVGGVYVACGDVDGDGLNEIVTGAGEGGGPHVRVFGADGMQRSEVLSPSTGPMSGARVACGDVDADGQAEVAVAAGPGGPPGVTVLRWSGSRWRARAVSVLGPPWAATGVQVAMGDLEGDGRAELLAALDISGATVTVVDAAGRDRATPTAAFATAEPRLAVARFPTGPVVVTAAGPGARPWVRLWTLDPPPPPTIGVS